MSYQLHFITERINLPYNVLIPACGSIRYKELGTVGGLRRVEIDETKSYGTKPALKRSAFLTLLVLYGMNPNQFGILPNVDIKFIQSQLHLSRRTIKKCLSILKENSYIDYVTSCDNYLNVDIELIDYEQMYRKKEHGGKGYAEISKETFYEIISLSSIDQIRLAIRSLHYTRNTRGYRPITLSKIKKWVKHSTSKKELINFMLNKASSFVDSSVPKDSVESIVLKQKYENTIEYKNILFDSYKEQLLSLKSCFDEEYGKANIKTSHLTDIVNIAFTYGIEPLKSGLREFYSTYVKNNSSYENVGALIRTLTQSQKLNLMLL